MSAQSGYFDITAPQGVVRVLWEIQNRVLSIRLQARNIDGYYGTYYLLRRSNTDRGLTVNGTYLAEFPATAGDWKYQFTAATQAGDFAEMETLHGAPDVWHYTLTNEKSVTIAFGGTLYRASPSAHSWGVSGSEEISISLGGVNSIYDGSGWSEYKTQIYDGSGWTDCKAQIYTGSAWEDY